MSDYNVPEKKELCKVFISYAKDDYKTAERLYNDLKEAGVKPWIDKMDLIPGQNWKTAIRQAIKSSQFIILILSTKSVKKRGYVQKEFRYALDVLGEIPEDEIFIIPVRLDDCEVPFEELRNIHWSDFFPSYHDGLTSILQVFPFQKDTDAVNIDFKKINLEFHAGSVSESQVERSEIRPTQNNYLKSYKIRTILLFLLFIVAVIFGNSLIKEYFFIKDQPNSAVNQSKIQLRHYPLAVQTDEAQKVFKLLKNKPKEYIKNEFEDHGNVVVDHATGLMWQKEGSDNQMTHHKAESYINKLNSKSFAGHSDWRLPTIDELISLLEPETQSTMDYINPMFVTKSHCWSADRVKHFSTSWWSVYFGGGFVSQYTGSDTNYVRAVRSIQNKLQIEPVMTFKWIKPGKFIMGSPQDELNRSDWEGPQHQVELTRGFYIQTTEVTQKQWIDVMGNNPSDFTVCDNCPVEQVSWNDIQQFIEKLNQLTGKQYRLPTEAEWEYAARASSTTAYSFGNMDEKILGDYAWHTENSNYKTHPVGQKKPNPWGLFDMYGNVWEWCQDWYGDYPSSPVINPSGPQNGANKVYRGGSYLAGHYRSAYRRSRSPDYRHNTMGFRLVHEAY